MSAPHVHYWKIDGAGVGYCDCDPSRLRQFQNTFTTPSDYRSFGSLHAIPSHIHRRRKAVEVEDYE